MGLLQAHQPSRESAFFSPTHRPNMVHPAPTITRIPTTKTKPINTRRQRLSTTAQRFLVSQTSVLFSLSVQLKRTSVVVIKRARGMLYDLAWIAIWLIYVVHGVFLFLMAWLYSWLVRSDLRYWFMDLKVGLPFESLKPLLWMIPLLGAAHLLMALLMVLWSVQERQLSFKRASSMKPCTTFKLASAAKWVVRMQIIIHKRFKRAIRRLRGCWSYTQYLGINSVHFELVFMLQELVQVVYQTYQCYWLSRLVASPVINRFAVAICVINCLSTPLVRVVFPKDFRRQRVLCVLCDAWLNLIQCIVIPVLIFCRCYQFYDGLNHYFSVEFFANAGMNLEGTYQIQQLVVASYLDFVMTLLPHIQVFMPLRAIQTLLERKPDLATTFAATTTSVVPIQSDHVTPPSRNLEESSVRSSSSTCAMNPPASSTPLIIKFRSRWGRQITWMHWLVTFYGIGIAAVHLWYQDRNDHNALAQANCMFFVSPWFVSKFSCRVIRINCRQQQMTGSHDEIARILDQMEPNFVARILFNECSALEIPSNLQIFHSLTMLEINSSTLVRWDPDAAINNIDHPELNVVYLVRSNLSDDGVLPLGLLGDDLPVSLQEITIAETNLTVLPKDLDTKWRFVQVLSIAHTSITELPPLPAVTDLFLVSNQIEWIDDPAFANCLSTLYGLYLSGNPLRQLPPVLGNMTELFIFLYEATLVSDVPVPMMELTLAHEEQGEHYVSHVATGSPFCDKVMEVSSVAARYQNFSCSMDLFSQFWLPQEMELGNV